MQMQFSESKVEYASHQLSLYYGECPHKCTYCFVGNYRKRNWDWANGPLRINEKAYGIAKSADLSDIECLVVSFTNDPLPDRIQEGKGVETLLRLTKLLNILEKRGIPTKVLTKNAQIRDIIPLVPIPYRFIQIGMTLTTNFLLSEISQEWEPHASPLKSRYHALRELQANGFRTWVSAEPILPGTQLYIFMVDLLTVNAEEIWIGKGNYLKELINAHNWKKLAKLVRKFQINPLISTKFHMKRELRKEAKNTE